MELKKYIANRRDFIWCWVVSSISFYLSYHMFESGNLLEPLGYIISAVVLYLIGGLLASIGLVLLVLGINILIRGGFPQ